MLEKLIFHIRKTIRLLIYNVKYRLNKWKTIEGIQLPVYMHYGYSVLRFIDDGSYESCEIAIVKHTLTADDIVLELGTGLGFISTYCAMNIGSERVFTYEGNFLLQPLISQVYKKNQVNPTSTFALLSEGDTNCDFYQSTDNFLSSSTIKGSTTRDVKVPMVSLNDTIKTLQPTYLVMDIEGGEYDIFKQIDFQSIKKIQFELHPAVLSTDQIQFIFKKLEINGFIKSNAFAFENNFYFHLS